MKRTAGACLLAAALGGCVSLETSPDTPAPWAGGQGRGPTCCGVPMAGPTVPGFVGPYGQPVSMAAPYNTAPPGEMAARAMMQNSVPLDMVQQAQYNTPRGQFNGLMPAGGMTPPGMPGMPGMPGGMGGPGAGQVPAGVVAGNGMLTGGPQAPFPVGRSEVRFSGPTGMKISWYTPGPDGKNAFAGTPIEAPGRYNFVQAAIYRLKLSDIPGRPGLELYPTLEVVPCNARTSAFLAHSAVPLTFTEEDFAQVTAGNYVVKVIYLPNPQFQDLATTGPEEIISSRLEPGVDPIAQAHARGSILLVVRLGNIDLEAPNTPAMDAPSPYMLKPQMPAMAQGQGGAGGPMVPYGAMSGRPGMGMPGMGMPGMGMPGMGMPGMGMPGMSGVPTGAPGMLPPAQGNGQPQAGIGPTSMKLPEATALQQTQYKAAASATPASLAGQTTVSH